MVISDVSSGARLRPHPADIDESQSARFGNRRESVDSSALVSGTFANASRARAYRDFPFWLPRTASHNAPIVRRCRDSVQPIKARIFARTSASSEGDIVPLRLVRLLRQSRLLTSSARTALGLSPATTTSNG